MPESSSVVAQKRVSFYLRASNSTHPLADVNLLQASGLLLLYLRVTHLAAMICRSGLPVLGTR